MTTLPLTVSLLWPLLVQIALGQLHTIDNEVVGEPEIECHTSTVSVNFKTRQPFEGHIFVRNHYAENECHKDYALNRDNGGFLHIPFENCGMRRIRRSAPRGLSLSATVVVSFHRAFITAQDRAYHVQCFYVEEDLEVNHSIGVSMLPTTDLDMRPPMPTCGYQVLGLDGQPAKYARVGDQVYHRWVCDYEMPELYCMIIHSCTVDDGEKSEYEVIDSKGCAKDPVILGELQYEGNLIAGTNASVFKFADKAHVFFTCQVQLSLKHEHDDLRCPRPSCGIDAQARRFRFSRYRHRRYASVLREEGEVDVQAEGMLVLDMDDALPSPAPFAKQDWSLPSPDLRRFLSGTVTTTPEGLCISSPVFGVVVGAVVMAAMTCVFVATFLCVRKKEITA